MFSSNRCNINKNMLDRTRLKTHLILPQTRESVVKRNERLASYNRKLSSSQSYRSFIPSVSTAPDHPRVHSAMQPRTHNQSAHQSSSFKIAIVKIQPFTQPTKKCHDRSQSPLSVIRSRSRCSQDESRSARNFPIRVNFLKKGSSVDRSIMKNILASKINTNVCPLAQSYVDAPQNNQIATIMQTQIPKGIRDVVGVEEMLRMSHIMTGVQFKTVSLHERVKQALRQHKRTSSMPQPLEEDDLLTLKSIKRW